MTETPDEELDDLEQPPDSLPPPESEEEGEGPDDPALSALPEASGDDEDLDDSTADELDVGTELAKLGAGDADEPSAIGFDVGELLAVIPDSPATEDGAEWAGSAESFGIDEELPGLGSDGDAESGMDEPLDTLVDGELPGLDADEEGDFEEPPWLLPSAADDGPPPLIAEPWALTSRSSEVHVAMATLGTGIAAAGGALTFWPTPDAPRRVTLPERATTLVGLADSVLVATVRGRLLRVRPDGRIDCLSSFEHALPRDLSTAPVAVSGGVGGDRVTFVLDTGQVVESRDECSSFAHLTSLRGVRAVTSHARHLLSERGLFDSTLGYDARPLEVPTALSQAERVVLASEENIVAIGAFDAGVWLSTDGGAHFRRVPHTSAVSALLVEDGEVFAALTGSVRERARLVQIELPSAVATAIAVLPATEAEPATVYSLVLAPLLDQLWAASSVGVLAVTRGPRAQ
ncbi:MAG: hypothetical protein KF718_11860 [Polyangiaceae bacterium]|nr:hypothetical protein [Polyangiaceae bacterium]